MVTLLIMPTLYGQSTNEVLYHTSYLENSDKNLESILLDSNKFTSSENSNLIFGITKMPVWVKLELKKSNSSNLILTIDRPLFDSLSVFYKNIEGQLTEYHAGFQVPNPNGFLDVNTPSLKINTFQLLDSIIYIRAKSSYSLMLPISIKTSDDFYISRQDFTIFATFLLGGLFIMMMYNFFIYISLKDSTYLVYSIGILVTLLIQSSIQGYLDQLLPLPMFISYYIISVGIALNVIISAWFIILFLEFKNFSRWMIYLLFLLIGMGIGVITL